MAERQRHSPMIGAFSNSAPGPGCECRCGGWVKQTNEEEEEEDINYGSRRHNQPGTIVGVYPGAGYTPRGGRWGCTAGLGQAVKVHHKYLKRTCSVERCLQSTHDRGPDNSQARGRVGLVQKVALWMPVYP